MNSSDPEIEQQASHSTFGQRLRSLMRNHGITLVLIAVFAYLWVRPPADVTQVNRPAGDWSVTLMDGQTIRAEQLKGKWVLVNLWATWCPYCLKEMPVIEEFWRDHRAEGFEVLAISVDDPPEKVAEYMRTHGYGFMAGSMSPEMRAAFGHPSSIPTSFVLDNNGTIRHKIVGQVHYARLKNLININDNVGY